jgi:hypothetical protein
MFGNQAYMKVEGAEESQPLHPMQQQSYGRERPWTYGLKLFGKGVVCLLAAYGLYSAVRSTILFTHAESHHHHHGSHEVALAPEHQGPILHDDGFVTWPDHKSCSCGKTVEEALAMGCKFDSHALAWLPEHCRDDELTAEFEKLGPLPDGSWELFATPDRTQPLNFSDISMKPGTKFYMTMEWHDMVSLINFLQILLIPSSKTALV